MGVCSLIKEKIGKRIKELRLKNNMTQEVFAELSGLDRTYITSLERGQRNISIVNLERIAKAFDISLSELLSFEEIKDE